MSVKRALSRIGASANAQLRLASRFSYTPFSTSRTLHFLSNRTLGKISQLQVLQQQQSPRIQCRSYADSTSSPLYGSNTLKTEMDELRDEQGQDGRRLMDDPDVTSFSSEEQSPHKVKKDVYVGNLDYNTQGSDIKKKFAEFGPILDVTMICDPNDRFTGSALLRFRSSEDAAAAVSGLDSTIFRGRSMHVAPARRPRRYSNQWVDALPNKTLFITNIPYDVTDESLNELFGLVEGVTDVRVAVDKDSGRSRGFLHAEFVSIDAAAAARSILMRQKLGDRRLFVVYQKERDPKNRMEGEHPSTSTAAYSTSATPEDITTTTETDADAEFQTDAGVNAQDGAALDAERNLGEPAAPPRASSF